MKQLYTILIFQITLISYLSAQTTEELFSLPGLKIVSDLIIGDEVYDGSKFYVGSFSDIDADIYIYESKQGPKTFFYFDGHKVYRSIFPITSAGELFFDFGLQEGDTMKLLQGIDHILETKEVAQFEDGLDRIVQHFSRPDIPDSTITIIEGIGYTQYQINTFDQIYPIRLQCATSDSGLIYIDDDFTPDECDFRSCINMRGDFTLQGNEDQVTLENNFQYYDSISMTFGDGIYFDEFVETYTYDKKGCFKIEVGIFNECGESYYYSDFHDNCDEQQWFGQSFSAFDISFVNKDVGYGIHPFDAVYKTIDGGDNWLKLDIPEGDYEIYSIYFIDEEIGIITTNTNTFINKNAVLLTTDGGESWQSIIELESPITLGKVVMNEEGFIFGKDPNGYYRFKNDGTEFTELNVPKTLQGSLIRLAEDGTLTIGVEIEETVGNFRSYLYISSDNGASFEVIDLSFDQGINIEFFLDRQYGFIGMDGNLYKTEDGGETWENVYSFYEEGYIKHLSFYDKQNGLMVINANIYITNDGGSTWNIEYCENIFSIFEAKAVDGEYFAVVALSLIKRNIDPNSECVILNSKEENSSLDISIYPNPTYDKVFLSGNLNEEIDIQILNTSGTPVLKKRINGNEEIDISHLVNGLYFISIHSKGKYKTSKIVKF